MKHLIFDCIKEMQPCGLRAVAKQLDADYDEVKELAEQLATDGKLIKLSNQQFKVASVPDAKHAPGGKEVGADYIKPRKSADDKVPEASEEDVEKQVRKAGGEWNHGNLVIMIDKRGVYYHQFVAKAGELFSQWNSIVDPKPSFHDWLKAGKPKCDVPDLPDCSAVDGDVIVPRTTIVRSLDTATTDELIEAVKLGKQAAEIIKKRLAEVGL